MSNMAMAQMLIEERKKIELEMRAILNAAEGRELTEGEDGKFNELSGKMNSLRDRADRLVQYEADARASEDALRALGIRGDDEQRKGAPSIGEQFRALKERRIAEISFTPTRGVQAVREEQRALSKGTANAGGNTVPTDFVNRLYEHMIETATLLRGGATVFNTNSGESIDMPVTTTHGTAALVAEAGTIPQADPVFGKRTLGSYKYGELILVSNELLVDTAVDLEGYLARMAGRAVGNALGAHLITGTGTAQPAGIVTSATLGATSPTGTTGAPTFDTLIDLYYSVIAPYRNSPDAGWLIKDTSAGALRKLKDSSGRYLWESSVLAGTPDTILSKPVYTDPNVPATALNAKSVIFGDLSTYYVRLVNNVRFERSDEFSFNTDQVAFRCLVRGDGLLLDQSGAVKYMVGAAT
jgi:HK97 family phage major capsid protein